MTDSSDDSDLSDKFQQLDHVIDDLLEGKTPTEDDSFPGGYLEDLLPTMRMLAEAGQPERKNSDPSSSSEPERKYSQLGGYQILREVGHGGMGLVFEAIEISLGRRVALKVLSLATMRDAEKVARFDRETQAVARLEHPRIVRAYARGEDHGIFYLAMQFIDGQDLAEFIRRRRTGIHEELVKIDVTTENLDGGSTTPELQEADGPKRRGTKVATHPGSETSHFSPSTASYFREVARIGQQVAEALQYAHESQIIHRDIKPSNLMMDKEENVYIADFGLAILGDSSDLTATGRALGTLRYSSPEQARGSSKIDARTDVYSLGVTLYELATLAPAFPGDKPITLLNDIQEREPIRPRSVVPKFPNDLESIILKAMSKAPRDRYQSAQELAADLQRFLQNEPVQAKQPTRLGHGIRWVQRNRLVSALGFVAVLLSLSIAFIVTRTQPHNVPQTPDEYGAIAPGQDEERRSIERSFIELQYVADLQNSHQAWSDRDLERAKRLLRKYIPTEAEQDQRGFVWYYLWKLYHQDCIVELRGHQGAVYHLDFSPDGETLASSSADGTVNLWNVKTKSLVGTLRGHTDEVNGISFSKDGTKLVSGSDDRTVRVWDVASRESVATLTGNEGRVYGVAISPDGKTVVSGGCDHTIRVFDLQTQETRKILREHTKWVQGLAYSPDGKTLASVGDDFRLIIWDTDSHTKRFSQVDENSRLFCVNFSHSGDLVVTAGAKTPVRIWDVHTGRQRSEMLEGTVGNSVAFSPDDTRLAVACRDGTVQVVSLKTREQISLFDHNRKVSGIAFSGDGTTLATACADGIVRLWSLPTADKNVLAFTVDRESQTLAMCAPDRKLSLREWATDSDRESFRVEWEHGFPVSMQLSPGGRKLAIAFAEKTGFIDLATKKLISHDDFTQNDSCIAYSSSGKFLAEGGMGGIRLLDPLNSQPLETLVEGIHVTSLIFSLDETTLIAGCANGDVKVWDVATRSQIGDIDAHIGRIDILVLTPDGKAFISGGEDKQIKAWDTRTQTPVWEIEAHRSGVDSLAVYPDGRTLASGGRDGVLKLWNLPTRQLLLNYKTGSQEVRDLTFSGDGSTLAFVAVNSMKYGELHMWHAAKNNEVPHPDE